MKKGGEGDSVPFFCGYFFHNDADDCYIQLFGISFTTNFKIGKQQGAENK